MKIYSLDVLLSQMEPFHCSMSSSNHCFLTCIQVSQEAGKVVCYSYLFKNFPQFVVIHTVKDFSVVNEAEVDVLHWIDGHKFEQAPRVGDGQGTQECCSPWSCKELDTTEWLNWTELNWYVLLELSCLFSDPADVGNLISGFSTFSKSSLNIWEFSVHVL